MALWDDTTTFKDSRTTKNRTRVAIVGSGYTRDLCPFQDRDLEVWGINEGYLNMPRWDKWFQIHSWDEIENNRKDPEHLAKLQAMKCPIYMQQHHDQIPNSVEYPLNEMLEEFGEIFSSTLDYMMAMAIMGGYKEIELYGIELVSNTEYTVQRPTFYYFMAVAKERGIKVVIPEQSKLKKPIVYAFQHKDVKNVDKQRMELLSHRDAIINQTIDLAKMEGFMLAFKQIEEGKKIEPLKLETESAMGYIQDQRNRSFKEKAKVEKQIEKITGHPVEELGADVKVY